MRAINNQYLITRGTRGGCVPTNIALALCPYDITSPDSTKWLQDKHDELLRYLVATGKYDTVSGGWRGYVYQALRAVGVSYDRLDTYVRIRGSRQTCESLKSVVERNDNANHILFRTNGHCCYMRRIGPNRVPVYFNCTARFRAKEAYVILP